MNRFREEILVLPAFREQESYSLLLAGTTLPDPDYRICRGGNSDLYVLEYIISGTGTLRYGDREYHPSAGDVYLIQPQVEHEYFSSRHDPWKKLWFNVRGSLMEALCEIYGLKGTVFFPSVPRLRPFFEEGMRLLKEGKEDVPLELGLLFHRILAGLGDKLRESRNCPDPEAVRMREYIRGHWRNGIFLRALTELTGKSESQVLRIFRKAWKMTPYECLLEFKEKNALLYLENTVEPVKNVAFLCGFKDEFYFSNWFRKRVGLSPAAYRKKCRRGDGSRNQP